MPTENEIMPLKWQARTNLKEHLQMTKKINELIDAVNTGTPVTIDERPTKGSRHLVRSGGVYDAIEEHKPGDIDDEPTKDSRNLVRSGGVYDADRSVRNYASGLMINLKQYIDDLVPGVDDEPIEYSASLVRSGGIFRWTRTEYDILKKYVDDRFETLNVRLQSACLNMKQTIEWLGATLENGNAYMLFGREVVFDMVIDAKGDERLFGMNVLSNAWCPDGIIAYIYDDKGLRPVWLYLENNIVMNKNQYKGWMRIKTHVLIRKVGENEPMFSQVMNECFRCDPDQKTIDTQN